MLKKISLWQTESVDGAASTTFNLRRPWAVSWAASLAGQIRATTRRLMAALGTTQTAKMVGDPGAQSRQRGLGERRFPTGLWPAGGTSKLRCWQRTHRSFAPTKLRCVRYGRRPPPRSELRPTSSLDLQEPLIHLNLQSTNIAAAPSPVTRYPRSRERIHACGYPEHPAEGRSKHVDDRIYVK